MQIINVKQTSSFSLPFNASPLSLSSEVAASTSLVGQLSEANKHESRLRDERETKMFSFANWIWHRSIQ